ncbi:undecaprenyl/decaprenyl-phosphate alpha-N-acetylglucosaminyl 1-phosphate transferase [Bacillus sp. YZJH907-2]|uniref:Undecaprenyl/decaprenyl-phosphate alpha-N-acetylglucosaminyl 1-phosphate transferase n=1 Tax=Halalkalibacter suaedae TaxID=2822140 RepID=A0A940WTC0_9BACI|nr:undecaprenyl/decaprenyl-phosphate alpha-N-acetylglucosaminyl 1-phosphate transferase [Bacillus suaedae]
MELYILAFFVAFTVSLLSTPLVIKFAKAIGAVDQPDYRKVHKQVMPRMGGIAIIIGTIAGFLIVPVESPYITSIIVGAGIIVIVGLLDDLYTLSAKYKLIGQLLAAGIVVMSGLRIELINLPFDVQIQLGFVLSAILTVLWIVAITNAINLIDGLDGLAAGVSTIALASILAMAILDGQYLVVPIAIILIGSILGFLPFNFNPAKIFMGDTGALFLGYAIAVISVMGLFKSVTVFSLVIPIIILAIPIFDTIFAIVRRILNKKKISEPDKSHLHHCLLEMGFSHRKTVLIIYVVNIFFGVSAIVFSNAALWGSVIIIAVLLLLIELSAELIGLIGNRRKPLINMFRRFVLKRPVRKHSN